MLMAFEMSHFVHELAKQRIRDDHPDWPEDKVTREFLRSLFPAWQSATRVLMESWRSFSPIVPKPGTKCIPYMLTGSFASSYYGLARQPTILILLFLPLPETKRPRFGYSRMTELLCRCYRCRLMPGGTSPCSILSIRHRGWKIDLILSEVSFLSSRGISTPQNGHI